MIIAAIIFWICFLAILHSYVLFPLITELMAARRENPWRESADTGKPFISILISAFNEEAVIRQKIASILNSGYPRERYEILIGSDCSTDNTNKILSEIATDPTNRLSFYPFEKRQGKPNVINKLKDKAKGEILILSDANVMFDEKTLEQLVKPFSNPAIGLVDSQMINLGMRKEGISHQEKAYISREVRIKHQESLIWGTMMGPLGGCFAIRKSLYKPVPSNFLVDDFYLNMLVLESGSMAISNPDARVYEDVSNDLKIEYRRKIRIATGNFQNLSRFKKLLWPPWTGLAFSFLSHKVIRWLGPFFLFFALISLLLLALNSSFYLVLFLAYLGVLLLPLIDLILKMLNFHIFILRFITHFCAMNLAMFIGFVRKNMGVRSNVWEPTKRNQT
jgi:cellulose synthase/poly-beta-1,6-N-acetylglucosamine synthase-like glycosyltransferase